MSMQYGTTIVIFNSFLSKQQIRSVSCIPVTNGLVLRLYYSYNEWFHIFHNNF